MSDNPASPPRTIRDLEYARPNGKPLLLDLHLPARQSAAPLPVIVWIHGGGWTNGDRLAPPTIATQRGYAVASIQYRFSQEAIWPAQIDDCKAAVRYVRSRAKEFGLDPNRIAAWGNSAGGHLVAMLAVLTGAATDADKSWHIQAACDYCGPSDLTRFTQPDLRAKYKPVTEVIEQLLGGPIAEKLDLARHASPLTHVTPHGPPLLIAHGALDTIVPYDDAELLHAALRAKGANSELRIEPHGEHHLFSPELDAYTMDFFDRVMK